MGPSVMQPLVAAVVTRHLSQCHRINDMKNYVSFYLRARYGSADAHATWYKNKHSKTFKTFQNTASSSFELSWHCEDDEVVCADNDA